MGKFRIEKLKSHLTGYFADVQTVVETGTFKGESTEIMAKNFEEVITIELDELLYKETSEKLLSKGYKNIEFLFGDSGKVITDITPKLKRPTVFFLDAHWSGDSSVNWEDGEWKGYGVNTAHLGESERPSAQEQVPMDREIRAIANQFTEKGVIYIDDLANFDFWGKGLKNRKFDGEDYSHLDLRDIRKVFGDRLIDWVNMEVQLIIKFDKAPTNEEEKRQQKAYYSGAFKRKLFARTLGRVLKRIFIYPFVKGYWKVKKALFGSKKK